MCRQPWYCVDPSKKHDDWHPCVMKLYHDVSRFLILQSQCQIGNYIVVSKDGDGHVMIKMPRLKVLPLFRAHGHKTWAVLCRFLRFWSELWSVMYWLDQWRRMLVPIEKLHSDYHSVGYIEHYWEMIVVLTIEFGHYQHC